MTTEHLYAVIRGAAIACLALSLGACASGPRFSEYASVLPDQEPDVGRIYFYRTTVMGAAVQPKVRIDNVPVGRATPKGFFFADRPPGNYEISTRTEAKRALTMSLDAGEEKYVRLEMKFGLGVGHVKPVLVDDEVGFREIQDMKYIGVE